MQLIAKLNKSREKETQTVLLDCFCVLDDQKIRRYLELGCEVKGMGRGHIKRIKDSLDGQPTATKSKRRR